MKKVLLLIAAVAASFSAIAEDFSMAKYREILKTNGAVAMYKYCYEANVSKESNTMHALSALRYRYVKKEKLTLDQINQYLAQFDEKTIVEVKPIAYAMFGFVDEAKKLNINNNVHVDVLISNYYISNKKYADNWNFVKQLLTKDGGWAHVKQATSLIQTAFRFKPSAVTKQEQINFIEKLAQIYPIPGTDFSQWKGFMGFIGYKYKALTGKDLFPENK